MQESEVESIRGFESDIRPNMFDKTKETKLTLRDGRKIGVKILGEDYYGHWRGKDHYAPIYSEEALEWLADEMMFAIRNKWDQAICIAGRERSGKSDLGIQLAERLVTDFDPSQVTFTQEEFKKKVFKARPYDVVIMDEAGEAMFMQEWNQRGQRDLVKCFLRFGILNLKTIIILPHLKLLNKQLRERRVHWWLECFAKDFDSRGYVQIRRSPLKQNPFDVNVFWRPVFTMKYSAYEKKFPEKWKRYEKAKYDFLEKAKKIEGGKQGRKTKDKERVIQSCKKLVDNKWEVPKIAKFFDLSEKTVKEYIRQAEAD